MKTIKNSKIIKMFLTLCLVPLTLHPLNAQTKPVKDVNLSYSSWIYKASLDSTVGADTSNYNFNNEYLKGYITIYNQNTTTADTLIIESYNLAKGAWVATEMGLKSTLTGSFESDNTVIIIAASATKTLEINIQRPGYVRIRPKVITGRAATRKLQTGFIGVN